MNIVPKVCILDFENAAISNLRSNYENVVLQGCHIHLGQIIHREVQERGLTSRHARDVKFYFKMKVYWPYIFCLR